MLSITFPAAPVDVLNVITSTSNPPVAGLPFSLTCVVVETVPGFTQQPNATWLNNDQEAVVNSSDVIVSTTTNSSAATSVLMFSSLRSSDGFEYRCVGILISLGNTIRGDTYFLLTVLCKL